MQCHETTTLPAGGMGEAHPALYVVAGGRSGASAQGWLERAANSLLLSPFHRGEGQYHHANGHHGASKFGATGGRGHDIRSCALGTSVEDARDENG